MPTLKKNHFQGPCDFLIMKILLCGARGKIRGFFGIELIKMYPIDSNVPVFENRKKMKITPP